MATVNLNNDPQEIITGNDSIVNRRQIICANQCKHTYRFAGIIFLLFKIIIMGILIGGPTPEDGLSAYQIWLNLGNIGTEQDFIDSLHGANGQPGANGASAYQVWLANGHTGSQNDFLNWLKADVTNFGQVVSWDMGVSTGATQGVDSATGYYVRIGGLVQLHGAILPKQSAIVGNGIDIKIKMPFAVKVGINGMPIASKKTTGNFVDGDIITAECSGNETILTIKIKPNATIVPGVFGFALSYITSYIAAQSTNTQITAGL